jgi:hypothetical protein
MAPTAWENSAIAHAELFERLSGGHIRLRYTVPPINLDHFKALTTGLGMLQFSVLHRPDPASGLTLDDNARALVAMCQNYDLSGHEADLEYIHLYLRFILHCQQPDGTFLNYCDIDGNFTEHNYCTDLADSNGRAIWALGHFLSKHYLYPNEWVTLAEEALESALARVNEVHSTRAMAFIIKGLYLSDQGRAVQQHVDTITSLADRMVQMYRHESDEEWKWFEGYFTYANSLLPEAMLCAWSATGHEHYKEVALLSFHFLLSKTFKGNRIKVVSNNGWLQRGSEVSAYHQGGEQPIDVAYTILALDRFYAVFKDEDYRTKMWTAFNWFQGANHLHRIMYNPCTGGCYDGLESNTVNLNQGAESTVSYLMARLTVEEVGEKGYEPIPERRASIPGSKEPKRLTS